MAELDFSDIKPDVGLSFDDIKPKSLYDYGPEVGRGFMRGFDKRKVGSQQAADDIRRWLSGDMGENYTPSRQELEVEAQKLKNASKNATNAEKGGEVLYDIAETAPLPFKGSTLLQKGLWNLGTGSVLGATRPTTSEGERADNTIVGGLHNAIGVPVATTIGKVGIKAARTVGHAVSDRFAKSDAARAGAEEVLKEIGKGRNIDLSGGGNFGGGAGGGSSNYGPGQWGQIEGANPTAAMLFQTPEILQLEKNARVRSGSKFLERDLANQEALWNSLKTRVYGAGDLPPGGYEGVRNYLNGMANNITTPMRDAAMAASRAGKPQANVPSIPQSLGNLLEDPSLWLRSKADGLLNNVKTRSDTNAKKLGSEALGLLNDLDQRGLKVDPEDVYNIKKTLSDRLTASENQAMDEMTQATKSGRVHATNLIDAADRGLNATSGGLWDVYNKTHSSLMKPIDEFAAMGKVLDSFENAPTLPNRPSVPLVTRAKLDTAISNNTWKPSVKEGYSDLLSPESRGLLNDAGDFAQAIEHAKGGNATNAISGSQTTPHAVQALKNGLRKIGEANNVGWAINLADALGTSQGQRALDEALLDPEKLKAIVDAYNHGAIGIEYSPVIQAMKRSLRNIPSLLD